VALPAQAVKVRPVNGYCRP